MQHFNRSIAHEATKTLRNYIGTTILSMWEEVFLDEQGATEEEGALHLVFAEKGSITLDGASGGHYLRLTEWPREYGLPRPVAVENPPPQLPAWRLNEIDACQSTIRDIQPVLNQFSDICGVVFHTTEKPFCYVVYADQAMLVFKDIESVLFRMDFELVASSS